jgi:ectoine hydroxylase-related dioxygenase (phytanoyl-CoA dioxygenase family)
MSSTLATQPLLAAEEAVRFHRDGYLGPYAAVSPEEMAGIRQRIDATVLTSQGPNPKVNTTMRHLDKRVIYDLCTHPNIVGRIQGILGPDLLLWAGTMWNKEPGGKEIPWHQDLNYWPVEPIITITAWIAIDEVTVENSCVELIPGSHKKVVPHIKAPEGKWFEEEADQKFFDPSQRIQLPLKPGEFILFNEKTLHHSEPNRSTKRRLGIAPRFTIPIVRIDHDKLFPGHAAILVSGEDYMGFNRLTAPPVA